MKVSPCDKIFSDTFVQVVLYTDDVTILFQVYELESLFCAMVDHSGNGMPPSKGYAYDALTTTIHDYVRNIKCKFHEELECKYCSLLSVRKFA